MARSDIYRREHRKVITENTEPTIQEDNFYESMPMTAQPIMREHTTLIREARDDSERTGNGVFLAERIVSYATGLVEALLGIRLLLSLFSYLGVITTANGFARFIYEVTNPLVAPFVSLFNASYSDPGTWTIAFAMLIYGMVGYAIVKLIQIGEPQE